MSRPSLYALQGFVAAARHGNLSHAAQSLHLTVSALSHQIRGLEEQLGQRLFVRKARGVELTADGQRLFERVAEHLEAIEQAMRPYRARRDDVLTITVLPSFATSWLVPRLPGFVDLHPRLEINLQSTADLVDFERDLGIDAGLRFGHGEWPGLRTVHLFDDWVMPSASPALLERLGRPTLRTLERFPLLSAAGNWSRWFETYGGTPPRRFVATFDDSETMLRAAVEGLGVALGRSTLMRPLVKAGLLVPLFSERLKSDKAYHLVYPPRSDDHAGLVAFREWLLAEARSYAALDSTPPPVEVRAPAGQRGTARKAR
ncbi:LysR substrate-binding domain-containing protein [Pyxidicoccus xibeiensis]|uniref:LysR substrate-binding domain-containing protein n=1 Tax=Pyxidicoccus xibeiensis TaxID=2906759 RepID=UPI0020A702F6|nr:LysR substrate-binding domain-containing protein [Pyxidicoccus xibeiensis]MCP3140376.1 LysR substrate-binding domain-containing protein [Pyxidicoccus xibeiensis]